MQPLFIFYLIIDKALMPICHDLRQTGANQEQELHQYPHMMSV